MFGFFKHAAPKYRHFGFVDNATGGVLLIARKFQNVNLLKEYILDATLVQVPSSSSFQEKFLDSLTPDNFCDFRWENGKIVLFKFSKDSNFLKDKSLMSYEKYKVVLSITTKINSLRQRYKKNMAFQETVYGMKHFEAQRFKDKGYPEQEILEYPYILQYADYAKISFKESADLILLKSKIDHETLAKTELLRVRYLNAIKKADTKEELDRVHSDFLLDYNIKI